LLMTSMTKMYLYNLLFTNLIEHHRGNKIIFEENTNLKIIKD